MSNNDAFGDEDRGIWSDDTTALQHGDIPPRALPRPSGPSWGTVALGLICLVVAGGAFWVEWASLDLDWTRSGPITLVGVGLILVLVGLAALLRRSDDDEDFDSDR